MKFQTIRGMKDFLPKEMLKKQFIEDTCRKVFELYGFEPWQTPVLEDFKVLSAKSAGGEEIKKEIYFFKDQGGREIGLRFDLTVPLARVIASNPQLLKPFKRYCIERVYRYDRPQKSRYREFTQADADIIGSKSMLCETECISIANEVFKRLELKVKIKINNRKLLEEIALLKGVKGKDLIEYFRIIDKIDKLGLNKVKKELREKNFELELLNFLKKNSLKKVERLFNEKQSQGLKELKELIELVKAIGLKKIVEIDLTLARGLNYYTGTVFEVKSGNSLSLAGGGRYDNLIASYGSQSIPAVGISFGIERILDLIEKKLSVKGNKEVLVTAIEKENIVQALKLANELRKIGIKTEMNLTSKSLSKSLEFAQKQGIPFVIILGENELKKRLFILKDMEKGTQRTIFFKDIQKLKKIVKN
jgi:histidyl-tRNA synthetase